MQTRPHSSDARPIGPAPNRSLPGVAKQIVRPMLAALAIDLLDLATFGPIGLYIGMILGAAVGYWLAPLLGFPPHRRWLSALATGVYCTLPLTGRIPLATLASVMSRAMTRGNQHVDVAREPDPEGAIDVEYEVVSDQPNPQRSNNKNNDNQVSGSIRKR
jgi:hypothetical protein